MSLEDVIRAPRDMEAVRAARRKGGRVFFCSMVTLAVILFVEWLFEGTMVQKVPGACWETEPMSATQLLGLQVVCAAITYAVAWIATSRLD